MDEIAASAGAALSKSHSMTVVEGDWEGSGATSGGGKKILVYRLKRANGTYVTSSSIAVASDVHAHVPFVSLDGKNLKVEIWETPTTGKSSGSTSINHTHEAVGEFSDGVFKITLKDANFSNTSSTEWTSSNVRDTSWFKNEIQKAIDAVVSSVQSALSGSITVTGNISCSAGDGSKSGSASAAAAAQASLSRTISGSYDTGGSWSFSVDMSGKWSGIDSDTWSCTASHGSSSSGSSGDDRPDRPGNPSIN